MRKEKIYNFLLFILIFLNIFSIIILEPISDLDELWNYNFAKNIADGLIPYRDFNMVITPLLSIVCGIILKITFNELIVMRILAGLLCSAIIYIGYKLFCALNIKKEIAIIFTFFIGYLFRDILCIDYNYLSLLLTLITIYNEVKYYNKDIKLIKANLKEDIFLGILAGLAITTKQTSGLLVCIALLGNKLLFVRNKEEFKIYFRSFIYRLLGILIPVVLMILYLLINNAFSDFISYTIKGVSEFSNVISYKTLVNWDLLGVLSILVPITFIYTWIKTVIFEKDKISYIFLVYGLAIFVIAFPISNEIHFLIGALPTIIIMLYELYNLLKKLKGKFGLKILKKEKEYNFIFLTFKYMIIMFLIYNCFLNFSKYIRSRDEFCTLNHFKYITINRELENQIKKVDRYITENENVKILDASASIYMIPIDRYNKDYDMFNKGNLGADGENRIIQEISNFKNTKYLILKDKFNKNWQTPLNIIDYIKENKTKIDEIEIFDIYE